MRAAWVVAALVGCGAPVVGGDDAGPADAGPLSPLEAGPYDGTGIPASLSKIITGVPWVFLREWPESFTVPEGDAVSLGGFPTAGAYTLARDDDGRPIGYDRGQSRCRLVRRLATTPDAPAARYEIQWEGACSGGFVSIDATGQETELRDGESSRPRTASVSGGVRTEFIDRTAVVSAEHELAADGSSLRIRHRWAQSDPLALFLDRAVTPAVYLSSDGSLLYREYIDRDAAGRVTEWRCEVPAERAGTRTDPGTEDGWFVWSRIVLNYRD